MNSQSIPHVQLQEKPAKKRPKNKVLLLDREACISCAGCVGSCPDLALDMYGLDIQIFQEECTYCTICVRACPVGALSIEKTNV